MECAFEDTFEEYDLCFAFEQKKQRLHFAIALRILRCRDPTLDPDFDCEVKPMRALSYLTCGNFCV